MVPWVLKDFRSPRRQRPVYQQGWNRKGLLSETGQRKQAFDVLAEHYRELEARQAQAEQARPPDRAHAVAVRVQRAAHLAHEAASSLLVA